MLISFYLWGFRVVFMQSGEVRRVRTTKESSTRRVRKRRQRGLRRELDEIVIIPGVWEADETLSSCDPRKEQTILVSRSSRPLRVLHPPSRHPVGSSSLSSFVRNIQSWRLWGTHFRPVGRVCVHLSHFVLNSSLFSLFCFFFILSIFMTFCLILFINLALLN